MFLLEICISAVACCFDNVFVVKTLAKIQNILPMIFIPGGGSLETLKTLILWTNFLQKIEHSFRT